MAELKVSTAELRKKAEELRNLNTQFHSKVEDLENSEKSLTTMYEGDARDAFHTAFTNDKNQFETFYNTIEQYIAAMNTFANNYDKTEQLNMNIASTRNY